MFKEKRGYYIFYLVFLFFLMYIFSPLISLSIMKDGNALSTYITILLPFPISLLIFFPLFYRLTPEDGKGLFKIEGSGFSLYPFFSTFIIFLLFSSISLIAEDGLMVNDERPSLILAYFLVTLFLVFFQAVSEELMYRILIYRAVGSKRFAVVLSSLFFMLMHLGNNEFTSSDQKWLMLIYYFLSGLFLMALALISNGFEAPIAFHYANNIFALGIENQKGDGASIPTEAIFLNQSNLDIARSLLILSGIFAIAFLNLALWRKRENGKEKEKER